MQERTKIQPVRLVEGKGRVSVTFHLTPFITKWEEAKLLFISRVAREIDPGLRPLNVTSSLSSDTSESWCKCRIFGGPIIATLRADSLAFDFPRAIARDYRAGFEITGRAAEKFLESLGYEDFSYFLSYGAHVETVQNSSGQYLARFAREEIDPATAAPSGMLYRPTADFLFRNDDGSRSFHKTIESSEIVPDGLYMTTYVYAELKRGAKLGDEIKWIMQIDDIVDRAAGIAYSNGGTDADS